ncbi:hypothetical protein [Flagellimonas sp. 2504JD4-2]
MDYSDSISYIIGSLLYGITNLLIIITCIVLVVKHKNIGTILMLIGSISILLFSIFNIVWTQVAARDGSESLVQATKLLSIIGPLPNTLFAIGLLLFAVRYVKKQRMD